MTSPFIFDNEAEHTKATIYAKDELFMCANDVQTMNVEVNNKEVVLQINTTVTQTSRQRPHCPVHMSCTLITAWLKALSAVNQVSLDTN